jgi:hypothetical protein
VELNPYQSPVSTSTLAGGNFRVDGKCLVVTSGAMLPQICVKTGEPVPHNMLSKRFVWCSPIVGLLIFLSPLVLIVVYLVVRKKCAVTFGLLPSLQKSYRRQRVIKVLAAIVLFLTLPFAAGSNSMPVIIIVMVLFLASIVSLFIGSRPLTITKYHKGEFWIRGCCEAALAQVEQSAAT